MYNRCQDMGIGMQAAIPSGEHMKATMHMKHEEMPEQCEANPGIGCPPIYECPVERVCHRQIVHQVPHICPVNTRIINHHIYRHSFAPCYSCCEENEVCNVYENRCCF